ncbi:hypothetical protein MHK_005823, partial [Candidatus Magnetomorum sp. HK-1]
LFQCKSIGNCDKECHASVMKTYKIDKIWKKSQSSVPILAL